MKFTAFNGSPAGEKSAAGRMLGVFLAGAARAGAETELYHLGDYSIDSACSTMTWRSCFAHISLRMWSAWTRQCTRGT